LKKSTALKKIKSPAGPVVPERSGSWHLARTETERQLSDFEFGLERLAQAYYRWKSACLSAVCDMPLSGDDVTVLNVVRMGDEPKRLSEVGQLLNRVDMPNLQYATRKLTRCALKLKTSLLKPISSLATVRRTPMAGNPHAVSDKRPYANCTGMIDPIALRNCARRWILALAGLDIGTGLLWCLAARGIGSQARSGIKVPSTQ
jgi:Winged helix DNA-binding domain